MIKHDFKNRNRKSFVVTRTTLSNWHWLIIGGCLLASALAVILATKDAEAIREVNSAPIPQQNITLTLPNSASNAVKPQATKQEPDYQSKTITISSGDTLSAIFKQEGFSANELYNIMQLGKLTAPLKNIRPGQSLEFRFDDNNKLSGLSYKMDVTHTLQVNSNAEEFYAEEIIRTPELRITHAKATINSSLYLAGKDAGLTDNLIMELAGIFGWDIDFSLDIRQGDNFTVMYEEKFLDGEKIGYGDIVAAKFINQGRIVEAVRYTNEKGDSQYFTPDGKSMRKEFLRSPVDFRRISSRFTRSRHHPVLGKKRPHRGVDYAATRGTPIKASGDGKIIFRGTKGGYGSTIIIQHGTRYTTLYAHLSNFKRGKRNGSYVKQGDIIGFVGSTGLATGPHLHYEFRVNGTHRNPLTVKFPDARPIKKQHKKPFMQQTQPIIAQLNVLSHNLSIAQNDIK